MGCLSTKATFLKVSGASQSDLVGTDFLKLICGTGQDESRRLRNSIKAAVDQGRSLSLSVGLRLKTTRGSILCVRSGLDIPSLQLLIVRTSVDVARAMRRCEGATFTSHPCGIIAEQKSYGSPYADRNEAGFIHAKLFGSIGFLNLFDPSGAPPQPPPPYLHQQPSELNGVQPVFSYG